MPEDFEEKSGESVNLRQDIAIAKRRRWHFLLPLILGWAVVWGGELGVALGVSFRHPDSRGTADCAVTCSSQYCQ